MHKQVIVATALAALLAGTGIASAQRAPENTQGTSATPAAPKQAAPAEKMVPSGGKVDSKVNSQANSPAEKRAMDGRANGAAADDRRSTNASGTEDRTKGAAAAKEGTSRDQTSPTQAQSSGRNDASHTSAKVNLSSDQRTRIRQTVIKQSNAPRVTRSEINFNLSVGTVVPRTVNVAVLPPAVIEIHPAWRGYAYIMVGDEIVILEPDTHRIVAIIPA